MRKLGLLVLSSVLGCVLTIGTIWYAGLFDKRNVEIKHVDGSSVGSVLTLNKDGDVVPLDFTNVADKVMPSVVHIKSSQTVHQNYHSYGQQRPLPDPFRDFFRGDDFFEDFFGGPRFRYEQKPQSQPKPQVRTGTGSGVIINENGYIITNNHVIDNADDIEVTLFDKRTYKATVVGTDPSTDLALIQIKESDLIPIPMVNSDDVRVGEWVMAVGNPFNLNSTVTAGIVSAKGRNINILKDKSAVESFIQTDAAINPGNSGGALVNLQGGLIGINTAIASPTGAYAGYGFAVPSNIVNKVVEDLLKYGVVQRGYLGIFIRGVDGNLAKEKDLEVTEGVYVDSIMENSSAGSAGVKAGDVILEVAGNVVKSAPELQEVIAQHRPGDKVILKVDRDGSSKTIDVILKNKDGEVDVVNKEHKEVLSVLGVELKEVEKKLSKKLDIDGGVQVVKLRAGKLKRSTNMREGFIITKVAGKRVKDVAGFVKILEESKGGVMLEGVYEDIPGNYYYAFGM